MPYPKYIYSEIQEGFVSHELYPETRRNCSKLTRSELFVSIYRFGEFKLSLFTVHLDLYSLARIERTRLCGL